MRIVFATANQGKMREIRQILAGMGFEILSMEEAGIREDVAETGNTFEENAFLKAEAVHKICGEEIVLADDSGLVIDFLNGEPGIYSSRYLGKDTSYPEKMKIILERMKDAKGKERSARFVSAIACILPDGKKLCTQAALEGEIARKPAGENGFGYDPFFYLPEYDKTAAELSADEKNTISHRGKALRLMREKLKGLV